MKTIITFPARKRELNTRNSRTGREPRRFSRGAAFTPLQLSKGEAGRAVHGASSLSAWKRPEGRAPSWAAAARCTKHSFLGCLAFWIAVVALTPVGRAEIPEPDNVLYGTITLDNVPVTAARTEVVIEARRVVEGPPVASYRMGSNGRLGNFYSLEIPLESLDPVLETNASQSGESLIIVVRDAAGVRGQTIYPVGERGQVQRVDFGTAVSDSDGDTLPDSWELLHFGNLNQNGASVAPNGATALANFVSGADPSSTNGLFTLQISSSNDQRTISFLALRAEGVGYEGRSRFYALESSTGVSGSPWGGVANFTNLPGNNQVLLYQSFATNAPAFFRGRVWLQGP